MQNEEEKRAIKDVVRKGYARIARQGSSCCSPSCCSGAPASEEVSRQVGYSEEELRSVPEGADLGLGCGNPTALASLETGETVLDLGSGAGFDCFLAARRVGEEGRVIGIDMTEEMIEKARQNARRGGYTNVEFRPGDIENLPVETESVDVVISNCVINLAPDKGAVFREAFRVLRPGGRMWISDLVLLEELPETIRKSSAALVGCVAGALMQDEYLSLIRKSGFQNVEVIEAKPYPIGLVAQDPAVGDAIAELSLTQEMVEKLESTVSSIRVTGRKPDRTR